MGNMEIWDALKTPPKEALKSIQGGRLRGKTDINPQWRYKAMTEHFGACGIGWKYTIEKLWLEPVGSEVCAFVQVGVSIKVDGEWSDPIPGIGGSMLLEQETKGLHVSDEAYKMATTDALSVALKMIGVAADVYAGLFDGSKYVTGEPPAQTRTTTKPPDKSQHWCKEHDTAFFKKGKMISFAHPIEGTKDWCHEPKQAEKDADSFPEDPPHAAKAAKDAEEATAQRKVEELPSEEAIDSDWLKESLKKMNRTEKATATWLVSKFGVEGGLLKDVLARLTKEQVAEFVKEIQDRLSMV